MEQWLTNINDSTLKDKIAQLERQREYDAAIQKGNFGRPAEPAKPDIVARESLYRHEPGLNNNSAETTANAAATGNIAVASDNTVMIHASPDLSKFTGVSITSIALKAANEAGKKEVMALVDQMLGADNIGGDAKSGSTVIKDLIDRGTLDINRTVNTSNYDKERGSTIIKFHTDFLDTLQPGNYIVRLNYGEKYIDTEITINAPLKYDDGSVNSAYRAPALETGGSFVGSGDSWMFKKADGTYALNEWICYNGRIYYIGKGGLMRTGLVMDESGAIYFLSTLHDGHYGAAVSGWAKDETGNTYFFDPENYKLVTGEKMIDGMNCTFADDGHEIS